MFHEPRSDIELSPGELLFREGEAGAEAYVLKSGQVEVFVTGAGGERRIAVRGPNEIFGEMALIDARPRSASVRALGRCTLSVVTGEQVRRRLDQADPITRMILEVVLKRCREMVAGAGLDAGPDAPATTSALRTLALESEIQRGISRQEFVLHYQPIVDLGSGELAGFEGLMRWLAPGREPISPAAFVPCAEATGLIRDLTSVALEEAQTLYPLLRAAGELALGAAPFLSINVTCEDLVHDDFAARIETVARALGSAASGLKIEVTESGLMRDAVKATAALNACRRLGVGVAIDDFGTGYSSLTYLATLPLTTLKIDRSFVQSLFSAPASRKIVQTILRLAEELEVSVVCEGVETEREAEALRSMGCKYGQGYLFGRPADLGASLKLIQSWRPRLFGAGETPYLKGKVA